jgi:hypothetical protein
MVQLWRLGRAIICKSGSVLGIPNVLVYAEKKGVKLELDFDLVYFFCTIHSQIGSPLGMILVVMNLYSGLIPSTIPSVSPWKDRQ